MIVSQQGTAASNPPLTGTATVQARAGSLYLNAVTESGDITKLEGYLHNLFGVLGEFKQTFISESRREIRGWVAESMQSGFSSVTDAMVSEIRSLLSEHNEQSQLGTTVAIKDPITSFDDRTQNKTLTTEVHDQRWRGFPRQYAPDVVPGQRRPNKDQILDATMVYRSTPLGLLILRIRRGYRWQRVEFIFHPIRFISRGMNLSFELRFDGRGYPTFRGGELYTYGIIDKESPIFEIICNDDIAGLRDALQSKTIAICDRGQMGLSLLHVSEQLCLLSTIRNV